MNLPPRFLNWKLENGRKLPCRSDGKTCDAHDQSNHVDYETARAAPFGVAFALRAEDKLFFLDLDNCLEDSGDWSAEATNIFASFAGAWGEVSQSGRGLHILGSCDPSRLKDRRNKWDGWLEFYTDKRLIAFGLHGWKPIGGSSRNTDWTDQLLKLVPQRQSAGDLPKGADDRYAGPADDEALLQLMLASKGSAAATFGAKATVAELWNADTAKLSQVYPAFDRKAEFDHSSADAALMCHLAFWTGKDMPRMDRLFRRSLLMRDKYAKREDYRRSTIQSAVQLCSSVYGAEKQTEKVGGACTGWEPLPREVLAPEPVEPPVLSLADVLDVSLADCVTRAAACKGAPVDYVAFALLTAAASLIGNARVAEPWSGWREPCVLWTMCVGQPSAGKSPAIDAIMAPLRVVEEPLQAAAQRELSKWVGAEKLRQIAEKAWENDCKAAFKNGEVPPERPIHLAETKKPEIPNLVISDVTVEKLCMICAEQPKGVLQNRDELAGWLQNMTRYSGGSCDRPFWLEAVGGRRYTADRVGRDSVIVPNLLVSVLGGIQPDKLSSLLLNTDEDGLLARFVPIWPKPVPITRPTFDLETRLIEAAFQRLQRLDGIQAEDGGHSAKSVPFSPSAQNHVHEFRLALREMEQNAEGAMVAFMGKAAGLAVRLSLILTYLDWSVALPRDEPKEISEDQFSRARSLVSDYILPMAERSYCISSQSAVHSSSHKLARLIKGENWTSFSSRDVLRRKVSGLSVKVEIDPALSELEYSGAIRPITPTSSNSGGRPARSFEVNPHLHQL